MSLSNSNLKVFPKLPDSVFKNTKFSVSEEHLATGTCMSMKESHVESLF